MNETVVTGKKWFKDLELIYSFFCAGIVVTLIFWPLLNSIFCLGLFAYWLFFSKKTFSIHRLRGRMIIFFSLLFLLVIIGSFYSDDFKEASFKMQQKLPYLIFPLVFGTTNILNAKVLKHVVNSFILSTFIGCLICIGYGVYFYFSYGSTYHLIGYPLVILKNMHPVVMGLCCILSIIFILEDWYRHRLLQFLRFPLWKLVIAFLLMMFLFLVGNRSNLIFFCGLIIFYGFRLLPAWRSRLAFIGSLLLLLILAVTFNPALKRQWIDLTDFSKEKSIQLDANQPAAETWGGKTIRLAIWRCALDVIKANWLTGVGTGDVYPALEAAYRARQFHSAAGHKEYNAHNQYMQETISYGIAGGLLLIALFILPMTVPLNSEVKTTYILFLLSLAFVCLTESLLELNKGIIWYAFFNAVFFFISNEATRNDSTALMLEA